ncbi:S8 family serine peptidase [Rossellomorea sp. y25]|uniref:S8 family serine peptidase n=1 Tax=Rossellomorea sp. y25 TaxID=3118174 RepID=UPI0030E46C45
MKPRLFQSRKKSKLKKSTYLLVTATLLLSIYTPFTSVIENTQAASKDSTVDLLSSLSEEQRKALKKLEATQNEGLLGFEPRDLLIEADTTVIIEFQSKPEEISRLTSALQGIDLSTKEAREKVQGEHQEFKAYAKKNNIKIEKTYQTAFNGMAVTLAADKIETLLELDEIKAIYKNNTFSIEPEQEQENNQEPFTPHMADSIPFLGIDRLHEEGITGKGVKVGVIDTGIDYHHPDLKDAFAGGYDIVDNDDDPMETTYEDWKASGRPLVDNFNFYYTSHGTHVSGTIAAQGKNTGGVTVKGVAPDVQLYGYRVLGPYGSGQSEDIIAGIDRAVSDGMDIINLSLGMTANEPFDPTSIAINNAVLSGVVAVVSAGNTGSKAYSLGTPGAAAYALTVGASSTSLPIVNFTASDGKDVSIELQEYANDFVTDLRSFENQSFDIVDLGDGKRSDYDGKNVEGKVVLVNRGVIGTQDKIVYAQEHGAKALLVYHNDPEAEEFSYYTGEDHRYVPTFYMNNQDGLELKDLLHSGEAKLVFSNYTVSYTKEDELAEFSSRGPSRENIDIKPEVTAPGVSILSTVPAYSVFNAASSDYQFAYDRYSGTSMAAPHVAGIAALMLQNNPDLQPADIKTLLMNTSVPLNGEYSVFDIGAGRVSPYEAIHSEVELKVMDKTPMIDHGEKVELDEITGGLSFGSYFPDEGHVRTQRSITIENKGKKKKQFDVSVEFTETSLDAEENGVQVIVDDIVKVKSNSETKTNVFLTVPKTAEIGMYEGYITFENKVDQEESYRIPFAFRTMESGFHFTELSSPAISPPYVHVKRNYFAKSWVDLQFSFKSPMKKIDFVLTEGNTGEDLGYLGSLNLESAYDGIHYLVSDVFNGEYFRFTDEEEQPIASKTTKAQPGFYKIKAIGTSKRDLVFTQEMNIFIDPKNPTLWSALDENASPVIEYPANQEEYTLAVKVHDSEIDQMISAGMNVDQSLNTINYSINNNYNPVLPVAADGSISLKVPLDANKPFMSYAIFANDAANNRSEKKTYYFIKEGMPYGYMDSNASTVNMGDTFTTTLVVDNVKDLVSGKWTIPNFAKYFDVVDVRPNVQLSDDANPVVNSELQGNNLNVTLDVDHPMSGELKAVDLEIKVKDSSFQVIGEMKPTFTYTNHLDEGKTIPFASESINIVPTYSELIGRVSSRGVSFGLDWTTVGATINLQYPDGTEYDGTGSVNRYGDFVLSKLPITSEPFRLDISLPGHFTVHQSAGVGVQMGDEVLGQQINLFTFYPTPGDVNQDDTIDILDALLIKENWHSTNRNADINFDRTVDNKDLNWVVQNYLLQNPDVQDPPEPQTESEGVTLEDILEELGVN